MTDIVDRLVNYNTCLDGEVKEAAREITRLRAENGRLRAENELRRKQMSRFPFCPDHRDKVYGKPCMECEIERLRSTLKVIYTWAKEDGEQRVHTGDYYEPILEPGLVMRTCETALENEP